MGAVVFPAPSAGGGIKSVQRGNAASAGTVTITSVDIAKSFVTVFGTASSGTVASSGTMNTSSSNIPYFGYAQGTMGNNDKGNFVGTMSGGTTNLVAAVVQGYLSNSTSLVVSGACRWEVVEFA